MSAHNPEVRSDFKNDGGHVRRPIRKRLWFYKPDWTWDWQWIKEWAWKPVHKGGDEFDWHTVVVGFPWTGQVVYAYKPCPYTGDCYELLSEVYDGPGLQQKPEWPIDSYGINHMSGSVREAYGWQDAHGEFCVLGSRCTIHENPYN